MSETPTPKNIRHYQFRAQLPQIVRVLAIVALAAAIIAVGIGFYRSRNNQEFRMRGFPTELSKDVLAVVNGYERRETDGDVVKYYIRADRATTYADNHQEFENAFFQVYDERGETFDQIQARRAVYVPGENKNFNAFFAGDVNIETRDALRVKTEQLAYDKATETANADESIEFARENVSGKSFGAIVKTGAKTLELLKDVEITARGGDDATRDIEQARITAGHAFLNQTDGKIDFDGSVFVSITPDAANAAMQPTDIKTDRATAFFVEKAIEKIELNGAVDVHQKPTAANAKWTKTRAARAVAEIRQELKQLELFENVNIETASGTDAAPTRIKTDYAVYQKDADRFELKNRVEIVTVERDKLTVIKSNNAIYEQTNGKIFLDGAAEITQGADFLKGDRVAAEMYPNKNLKNAFVTGNAYLKQTAPERTTEAAGNELNAFFGDDQRLQTASVVGAGSANLVPARAEEYTKVSLSAPHAIRLNFNNGLLREMQTEGRTNVSMFAPASRADAANRKLTADRVKTVLNPNGQDLARAEAVGNAEMLIEPLKSAPDNYRTNVYAARFDCDFFETGNNPKTCHATGGRTKTVRVPTVATENRGTQTLTADRLDAAFDQKSGDVQQFEASGDARFGELDRSGAAHQIVFNASDETVRLRGNPLVSDARARAKADEIDWDTRNEKSYLRGKVSTTYVSQKQTGGATPFGESNAPVFVTSETAEFQHQAEIGVYSGNARAWQENNYVRADKLILRQKQGELYGEGAVQSLLYDAQKRENGAETNVPVFAESQKIYYFKDRNLLRYENSVDIRQGTDRITAGAANVFLDEKNEVRQTVAEQAVVVTSPNRKATGDYAEYTAASDSVVLRGNPARIDDAESGTTQAAQVTVNLRTNNVVSESRANQTNTGRIRTVYKIKKPQ